MPKRPCAALDLGDASGSDGTYRITVPARLVQGQEAELTVNFIGYRSTAVTITLSPGVITRDFSLERDVLGLDEVVITGVIGETPMTKVPFAVGRLSEEELKVPAVFAEGVMRGKIAGVRINKATGAPGSAASVQLRGATSINASDRSQEPLYIVDGVILGATLADIDALDIESIEVVKGAASIDFVSYEENQLIIPEYLYQASDETGALAALNAVRAEIGGKWGLDTTYADLTGLTGKNLLDAILEEKIGITLPELRGL